MEESVSCHSSSSLWFCCVSSTSTTNELDSYANSTFASSVYTSAISDIMSSFHVSQTVALLPFSLFLVGLAFGPVLAAPLSERFGRTATYLISMPLFALFTLSAGFSSSFASLTVCRFFAGMFGSPPLVVGAGTNADLWLPQSRAAMTTLFALCPYLGPAIGLVSSILLLTIML